MQLGARCVLLQIKCVWGVGLRYFIIHANNRIFTPHHQLCHSLRPAFDKLASMHPNAIFVDVPVTDTNANLHQGLNIDSVPYAHVYSPTESLVEETKLSRKNFSEFAGLVGKHCS